MVVSDHEDDGEKEDTSQEALATIMGTLKFAGVGATSNQNMHSTQSVIVESPTLPEHQATDGLLSRRIGSSSKPLNIDPARPNSSHIGITPDNPNRSSHATPDSGDRAGPRTDNVVTEGPMTPRNDAGPFVFDGSAGRVAGQRGANNSGQDENTRVSTRSIDDEHSLDSID